MRKPEFIARQGRRPTGLLGHVVARFMAVETKPENDRAIELIDPQAEDDVLEIGFGHGHTLRRLSEIVTKGHLAGVDFSDVMLNVALHHNRRLIKAGRLVLKHADSFALPFHQNSFDKCFSVHTIYFWEDIQEHLAEAFRVLRPKGRLILGFRSNADRRAVEVFPGTVYRFPSNDEVLTLLGEVGFEVTDTRTENQRSMHMTWMVARKPLATIDLPVSERQGLPSCIRTDGVSDARK